MSNALMYFDPSRVLAGFDAGVNRNYELDQKDQALERAQKEIERLALQNSMLGTEADYRKQLYPLQIGIQAERARQAAAGAPLWDLQNQANVLDASAKIAGLTTPFDASLNPLDAEEQRATDLIAQGQIAGNAATQQQGFDALRQVNAKRVAEAVRMGRIGDAIEGLKKAGYVNEFTVNPDGTTVTLNGQTMTREQAIDWVSRGASAVIQDAEKRKAQLVLEATRGLATQDNTRLSGENARRLQAMKNAQDAYDAAIKAGEPEISARAAYNRALIAAGVDPTQPGAGAPGMPPPGVRGTPVQPGADQPATQPAVGNPDLPQWAQDWIGRAYSDPSRRRDVIR